MEWNKQKINWTTIFLKQRGMLIITQSCPGFFFPEFFEFMAKHDNVSYISPCVSEHETDKNTTPRPNDEVYECYKTV